MMGGATDKAEHCARKLGGGGNGTSEDLQLIWTNSINWARNKLCISAVRVPVAFPSPSLRDTVAPDERRIQRHQSCLNSGGLRGCFVSSGTHTRTVGEGEGESALRIETVL
jgi:hypothetical protein